jgi:pimeloyl-ACP methyl ester carboxylesterase
MQLIRSADSTEIAVDRSGEGPPLVLVGGAFQDRSSMKTVAAGLQGAFTVYEYDRRGRGDSGASGPYAIEREVEDLAAVIDMAGEPAFVFGQSSGGALALEAAARGVPIRALVVNEPPYTDGPSDQFADHLDDLVGAGRPADATAAFLELIGTPPSAIAALKAQPTWARMQAFAPTLSHEVRLCNNGNVPTSRLAGVWVPVLALAGEASAGWAHDVARAIAGHVAGALARVLPGQGHLIADDVLITVLEEFFLPESVTAGR